MADPDHNGDATVPFIWDKVTKTIVNNNSKGIILMLNNEFNHLAKNKELNLFPKAHEIEINKF